MKTKVDISVDYLFVEVYIPPLSFIVGFGVVHNIF